MKQHGETQTHPEFKTHAAAAQVRPAERPVQKAQARQAPPLTHEDARRAWRSFLLCRAELRVLSGSGPAGEPLVQANLERLPRLAARIDEFPDPVIHEAFADVIAERPELLVPIR